MIDKLLRKSAVCPQTLRLFLRGTEGHGGQTDGAAKQEVNPLIAKREATLPVSILVSVLRGDIFISYEHSDLRGPASSLKNLES